MNPPAPESPTMQREMQILCPRPREWDSLRLEARDLPS